MWVWLITQQRPHLALELRPPAADIATIPPPTPTLRPLQVELLRGLPHEYETAA
jgi:hypothetical protein